MVKIELTPTLIGLAHLNVQMAAVWTSKRTWARFGLLMSQCHLMWTNKGAITLSGSDSHLCIVIGLGKLTHQSWHKDMSHCRPVWLRPKYGVVLLLSLNPHAPNSKPLKPFTWYTLDTFLFLFLYCNTRFSLSLSLSRLRSKCLLQLLVLIGHLYLSSMWVWCGFKNIYVLHKKGKKGV